MSFPTGSGFNFGGTASGQPLGTQSQGSLFGGGAATTGDYSSNMFGSNLTTFGSASGSAPTFGSNTGGFSFSSVQSSAATAGATGFSFGTNTTNTPAFGQPQNQPISSNTSSGFGLPATGSNLFAGIQSQSQATPAATSSAGGFSFGVSTPAFASSAPVPASSSAGLFSFAGSSAPATTTPAFPPVSFGAPPATTTTSQPAQTTAFTLAAPTAGASSAAAAASDAGGFSFGGTSSAAISLATSAPQTTTGTGFSFDIGGKPTGSSTSGVPTTTAATTAVTNGSQPSSTTLTLPGLGSGGASAAAVASFGFGASTGASAVASGGFSLGASAAGSEKTASGGFNFGTAGPGGKGTDQTSTGTAKETAPAASSTAAKTEGFSFAAAPASSNAFAGLSSAPAVASASTGPVSVPSDIKDLSLDEVVNKWTDEVADLGAEFQKAAMMVSKWDRAIVGNEDKIHALHKDAQALKIAHSELSSNLDVILSQQSELHNLLDALETDVEQKIGSPVSQLNSRSNYSGKTRLHGDVERESMHRLSVEVMDELDSMTLTIRNLVLDLNKGRNVSGKDGSGDTVSQIVSVLNAHLDSLQYLDESSSGLQKRLADVSRACEVVSRDTDRMYTRRSAGLY